MKPLPFSSFESTYKIIEELGRGASAICYHILITNTTTPTHHVLKQIPLHLLQPTPSPTSLPTQIQILSTINHPNLIQLQSSYISSTHLYLLFPYSNQKDLQKIIKQHQQTNTYISQSIIWKIFKKIIYALNYLHNNNIIHRDIKPSNIFIDPSLTNLKIGDLGTAKFQQNQNYTRIGTPLYLPPQIIKYQSYTQKVDIWSLGITIYYLTALKLPFNNHNFIKLAEEITYQQIQYPKRFSKKLKECLNDMLRKEPKERISCEMLIQKYFQGEESQQEQGNGVEGEEKNEIDLQIQSIQQIQQQQEQQWNIQLLKQAIFNGSAGESILLGSKSSIHKKQQLLRTSPRISSIKSIHQLHKNSIYINQDQIRQNISSKTILQDIDTTIILQVNPNDYNNFNGYYRESMRQSKIHFNNIEYNDQPLKLGRKSSLFKQIGDNHQIHHQYSHFKMNVNKQNKKIEGNHHKRHQSGICNKVKHGELMSCLKPTKKDKEKGINKDENVTIRPQLLVIDRKPLLLPLIFD